MPGTLVHLSLPFLLAAPVPQDQAAAVQGAVTPAGRILVLDDREFPDRKPLLSRLRAAVRGRDAPAARAVLDDLERRTAAARAPLSRAVAGLGGAVKGSFWLGPVVSVQVPPGHAAALAALEGVVAVRADEVLRPHLRVATAAGNHDADAVQQGLGLRGLGATLFLLDSGIDMDSGGVGLPHKAFDWRFPRQGTRIQGAVDVVARTPRDPEDRSGHGTAVAGIAVGKGWDAPLASDEGFAADAALRSYRVTLDQQGNCLVSDVLAAWQLVAIDGALAAGAVANHSYSGRPDPMDPVQFFVDAVSYYADVLVVTSAGNDGQLTTPTFASQSNANGLAVAAVAPNSHAVPSWSSYGPLLGDPQRSWPDLAAVGAPVTTPTIDDPRASGVNFGTSFAAPCVAGTALVLRGMRPDLDATDTKALILNSVQDLGAANPTLNRHHYGLGLLRTDEAVRHLLQGSRFRGGLNRGQPTQLAFPVPVRRGTHYAATLCWQRSDFAASEWDDLDLAVVNHLGLLVAAGNSRRNLYERLLFAGLVDGWYTLLVTGMNVRAPRVEFSLVCAENRGGGRQPGVYDTYAPGCTGSAPDPLLGAVLPQGSATAFGARRTRVPFAYGTTRFQQAFDHAHLGGTPFTIDRLAFRRDEAQGPTAPFRLDLQVWLGYTALPVHGLATAFASNPLPGSQTLVLDDRAFDFHGTHELPGGTGDFEFVLPLRAPFQVATTTGRNLLLEVKVYGSDQNGAELPWYFDAAEGGGVGRVYTDAKSATATSGIVDNLGLVTSLVRPELRGARPDLSAWPLPQLGTPFDLVLRDAPAQRAAVLVQGYRDDRYLGIGLPFDLGMFGAPGCALRTEVVEHFAMVVGPGGQARLRMVLPQDPALTGTLFYQQALVLDPGANALGLTVSNVGRGLVGQ